MKNNDEPRSRDADPDFDDEYVNGSFADFGEKLRRQRGLIMWATMSLVLLLLIVSIAVYLWSPAERLASLPFRLEFQGVENRRYPSGVLFTTGDIVATPVIRSVYDANDLQRYCSFAEFSNAVYVVEENEALRQLANEYRAKLSDPKLSAVDRVMLEQQFAIKQESIARNSYTLNYAADVAGTPIPNDLIQKLLRDILDTWAEYARDEKGAVRYQMPVFSTSVLPPVSEEPIVALDLLRSRIWDIVRSIQTLRAVPGAEGLRTKSGSSLAEIEVRLEEVIRLYIRPLVNEFRAGRYEGDRATAIRFIESQLDHVEIRRDDAAARVAALRDALELYGDHRDGSGFGASAGAAPTSETVMPQLNESFLDRIVGLAGLSEDQKYRQEMVNRIASESLHLVPYETEIEFYTKLLRDLRSGEGGSGKPSSRTIEQARELVAESIRQANEIYELASENLNASRTIFTVTGPVDFLVTRSVPLSRLLLIDLLILLIAMPSIIGLAVIIDTLAPASRSADGSEQRK